MNAGQIANGSYLYFSLILEAETGREFVDDIV